HRILDPSVSKIGCFLLQVGIYCREYNFALGNSSQCFQFFLCVEYRLNDLVAEENCIEHDIFREFISSAFNHADGVTTGGNNDLHVTLFKLLCCRVGNEFTVDTSDLDPCYRPGERNVRDLKGC